MLTAADYWHQNIMAKNNISLTFFFFSLTINSWYSYIYFVFYLIFQCTSYNRHFFCILLTLCIAIIGYSEVENCCHLTVWEIDTYLLIDWFCAMHKFYAWMYKKDDNTSLLVSIMIQTFMSGRIFPAKTVIEGYCTEFRALVYYHSACNMRSIMQSMAWIFSSYWYIKGSLDQDKLI